MLFKILHGDASRISTDITPYHEGYCYVTHDGYFYVDMNNQRVKLNAKDAETLTGASLATILNSSDFEIPTSKAVLTALSDFATNDSVASVKEELQANIDGKANSDHSHEEYLTEQKQADWEQTDETAVDYIKNKPEIVSDDEFLAWLNEAKIVEPVAATSGEIYTNNDNEIYVL